MLGKIWCAGLSGFSVRTKLLITSIICIVLVAGIGGGWMMGSAKTSLTTQIDAELQRSAELMALAVRNAAEANVKSYLRGVAQGDVAVLGALQHRVSTGEIGLEAAKQLGAEFLLSQRVGDSSYVYAIDSSGVVRVHPKPALRGVDWSQHGLVREQTRLKAGELEYDWTEPGDTVASRKVLAMSYFAPWDWIVSVSANREDSYSLLDVASLSKSFQSIRFGKNGQAYVISASGKMILPVGLAIREAIDSVDEHGRRIIHEMSARKEGRISYLWRNSGEREARRKVVAFRYLSEPKWIVAMSVDADELYRPLRVLQLKTWITAAAVLVTLLAAMYIVGNAIAGPLRRLAGNIDAMWKELGLGAHMTANASEASCDEIKTLTARFDEMGIALFMRDTELSQHRQGLETLVAERTQELSQRNEDMHLVLDTIDQGLAIVDLAGHFGGERSAAFHRWFGPIENPQTDFYRVLAGSDLALEENFQLAWEAVVENELPLDVTIAQLPSRLERSGRYYALAYRPILGEQSKLSKLLLIVSDVTSETEQLAHEKEQRELLAVLERVMKDRTGFIEFFNEGSRLADDLAENCRMDDIALARTIHTLKGNAGIFGVTSIAELCHSLEDEAVRNGIDAMRRMLPWLVDAWTAFSEKVIPLIGATADDIVEIHHDELEGIAGCVRAGLPAAQILEALERLKTEPVQARLERIAEQARRLAIRLGKAPVEVEIRAGNLRLPADRWSEVWAAFVHAVRNAIDHGLEEPAQRLALGKPVPAKLLLEAKEIENFFVITLQDDGRGIDWNAVRERARAAKLPAETQQDLFEALFANGVSTASVVSDLSGRGVGMGAVREAVKDLSGTVTIETRRGEGTAIRLRVPVQGNKLSTLPGVRPTLVPPQSVRNPRLDGLVGARPSPESARRGSLRSPAIDSPGASRRFPESMLKGSVRFSALDGPVASRPSPESTRSSG